MVFYKVRVNRLHLLRMRAAQYFDCGLWKVPVPPSTRSIRFAQDDMDGWDKL